MLIDLWGGVYSILSYIISHYFVVLSRLWRSRGASIMRLAASRDSGLRERFDGVAGPAVRIDGVYYGLGE